MEIVNNFKVKHSEKSGNSYKPISRNAKKEECKKKVEVLINENNKLYKVALKRGRALPEEKIRHHEIIEELRQLKRFVGIRIM